MCTPDLYTDNFTVGFLSHSPTLLSPFPLSNKPSQLLFTKDMPPKDTAPSQNPRTRPPFNADMEIGDRLFESMRYVNNRRLKVLSDIPDECRVTTTISPPAAESGKEVDGTPDNRAASENNRVTVDTINAEVDSMINFYMRMGQRITVQDTFSRWAPDTRPARTEEPIFERKAKDKNADNFCELLQGLRIGGQPTPFRNDHSTELLRIHITHNGRVKWPHMRCSTYHDIPRTTKIRALFKMHVKDSELLETGDVCCIYQRRWCEMVDGVEVWRDMKELAGELKWVHHVSNEHLEVAQSRWKFVKNEAWLEIYYTNL